MTLIYLVRHGETDWNRQRRIQGSTDIPLNDLGRSQAARTGSLLSARRYNLVASSPLSRALETGRIIAQAVSIAPAEIEIVDALAERAYGEAEGLDHSELAVLFPGDTPVPGREKRSDVAARVIAALIALAERHPGGTLIVTTHGGVVRAVLNAVAPAAGIHRGVAISNGSIHSFRHVDGELRLVNFNDLLENPIENPIQTAASDDQGSDLSEQNAVEQREG